MRRSPMRRSPMRLLAARTTVVAVRTTVVAAVSLLVVLTAGRPALAHTEIEIDNPQAGATNVTMTMTAEAESSSAGIASVRVVLPEGMRASDVTLTTGPDGWALAANPDGFTASGAALPARRNAKLVLRLAQLPASATPTVLAFKTLVTYTNGQVDRWIEPPSPQNPNPDHPAPTVSLRPGAAPSPSPSATPSSTPAAASPTATQTATTQPEKKASSGSSTGAWIAVLVVALVVVAGAGGFVLARRRRTRS